MKVIHEGKEVNIKRQAQIRWTVSASDREIGDPWQPAFPLEMVQDDDEKEKILIIKCFIVLWVERSGAVKQLSSNITYTKHCYSNRHLVHPSETYSVTYSMLRREINTLRGLGSVKVGEKKPTDLRRKCVRCRKQFGLWRKVVPIADRGMRCQRCKFNVCKQCRHKQANGLWMCCLCVRYRLVLSKHLLFF